MGAITRAPRRPGVVLDTGMCARSLLGNREISWSASATCVRHWSGGEGGGAVADDVRSGEVCPRHSSVKPTNKAGQPAAELVEPRAGAEGSKARAGHSTG